MIGALIGAFSPVAYLVAGFLLAAWDAPSLHQRLADDPSYTSWQSKASAARMIGFMTVIFWPVRLPYLAVTRMADKSNPVLIQRELARREEKIREREREIKRMEAQLDRELNGH